MEFQGHPLEEKGFELKTASYNVNLETKTKHFFPPIY